MITGLSIIPILVRDQDEALRFYTEKFGFEVRFDQTFPEFGRWLTITPKGQKGVEIVLQVPDPKMHGEERAQEMLAQIGKAPTWVLGVDNCQQTYEELRARDVEFVSPPTREMYGIEAVCKDLYGNTFSLVEVPQQG